MQGLQNSRLKSVAIGVRRLRRSGPLPTFQSGLPVPQLNWRMCGAVEQRRIGLVVRVLQWKCGAADSQPSVCARGTPRCFKRRARIFDQNFSASAHSAHLSRALEATPLRYGSRSVHKRSAERTAVQKSWTHCGAREPPGSHFRSAVQPMRKNSSTSATPACEPRSLADVGRDVCKCGFKIDPDLGCASDDRQRDDRSNHGVFDGCGAGLVRACGFKQCQHHHASAPGRCCLTLCGPNASSSVNAMGCPLDNCFLARDPLAPFIRYAATRTLHDSLQPTPRLCSAVDHPGERNERRRCAMFRDGKAVGAIGDTNGCQRPAMPAVDLGALRHRMTRTSCRTAPRKSVAGSSHSAILTSIFRVATVERPACADTVNVSGPVSPGRGA